MRRKQTDIELENSKLLRRREENGLMINIDINGNRNLNGCSYQELSRGTSFRCLIEIECCS